MELDSHVDPNDLSTGVNPCLLGKRIASFYNEKRATTRSLLGA